MDIEFHYHLTYLISRFAGFDERKAFLIASSAQFVDDNTKQIDVYGLDNSIYYQGTITSTYEIFSDAKELVKTLGCFHFIPGEKELLKFKNQTSYDSSILETVTTPNSIYAKTAIKYALKTGNPYLIGIACHAYADTWAHQNFTALNHSINHNSGYIRALIPSIGHAEFLTAPDEFNKKWNDHRLNQNICNNSRFKEASFYLFLELSKSTKSQVKSAEDFQKLLDYIFRKIKPLGKRKRLQFYNQIISDYFYSDIPSYDAESWQLDSILFDNRVLKYYPRYNFEHNNWHEFNEAALNYKNFMWNLIQNRYKNLV